MFRERDRIAAEKAGAALLNLSKTGDRARFKRQWHILKVNYPSFRKIVSKKSG